MTRKALFDCGIVVFVLLYGPLISLAAPTFTITEQVGAHGSMDPPGNITVSENSSQTITITPDPGYYTEAVLIDGAYYGDIPSYTFNSITSNHTISASFKLESYPLIISSLNGAVTVTPNQIYFDYGAMVTLQAEPDPGFTFAGWQGDLSGTVNPVTLTMNSRKDITAAFTTSETFTITASAGAYGAITPSGASTISYGDSQTYVITPDAGYIIEDVVIDGLSCGGRSTYTFDNITGPHTITASFAPGADKLPLKPETFDVPYTLPTGGQTWTVNQGDDLQSVINSANLGDVIVLQAGATFRTPYIPFKLPYKRGNGWLYIISSELSQLPEGTRVGPVDSLHMPKIVATDDPNGLPALITLFGAHHYRLAGIEIVCENANGGTYNLVLQGHGFKHPDTDSYWVLSAASSVDEMPHHIVYDRCYLHSISDKNYARTGINANGSYIAIINSYFKNFKDGSDSQAIQVWDGPGPYKIVNNFLESTGENIMFGGTDPVIQNLVPSDIEIRGNYFYKPLYWRQDNPDFAGKNWTIKNHFELKNAQRVWLDGNVMENNWDLGYSGQQRGFSIVLTPRNQNNTAPWSVVQDVTITNNIIRNVGNGMNILSEDSPNHSLVTQRILFKNNVIDGSDRANYGGNGCFAVQGGNSVGTGDLFIDHNLCLHNGTGGGFLFMGDWQYVARNMTFDNNIVTNGNYGAFGSGKGMGTPALDYYTGTYNFTNNAIINRPGDLYYSYYDPPSTWYPPGNFFPDDISGVGFTDFANKNFRLLPTSPYKNAGTDGKDLGPDFDALDAATQHAIDGNGTPVSPNIPPRVNAGNNQTIDFPNEAALQGSISDDGSPNPPGKVDVVWKKVSGPGSVIFSNNKSVTTTASFSSVGTYVLSLTAYDGAAQVFASVTITVQLPSSSGSPSPGGKEINLIYPDKASVAYFTFHLDGPKHVVINIYGRDGLIKEIADKGFPAGDNTVSWDGTNSEGSKVASGIYIVIIKPDGQEPIKEKVAVVR
ncbi:MAG: hypothetical protein LHV69_03605 [Elusimicrobia bacterium]|nr:hypothetical protein [Candidatus Obscuribacterium magneticum]